MADPIEDVFTVANLELAGNGKPCARCVLRDQFGTTFVLLLVPGDSLDVLYEAWGRRVDVLIRARVVNTFGRSKMLVEPSVVALAAPPRGATVVSS